MLFNLQLHIIKCNFKHDIVPELSADRSQIKLRIIGRISEFASYWKTNDEGQFEPIPGGDVSKTFVPAPQFLETYYEATETVNIGDSILLGGLATADQIRMIDKIPGLGDIPVLGRLFRRESTSTQWKSTLLIITPTVIKSD